MKRLGMLALSLVVLAGCNPMDTRDENAAATCKEKGVKCEGPKCFKNVYEEGTKQEEYTVRQNKKVTCQVPEQKLVVKKYPVKTYKVVEEWVDAPVREKYIEEIEIRSKKKVPVKETYIDYEMVEKEVDDTKECAKRIVEKECRCEPYTTTKTVEKCDACGGSTKEKLMVEGNKLKTSWKVSTETALCPIKVKKMVKVPVTKERTVMREGFFTDVKKVEKWRTVPGKVLVKKRVCETVMVEKKEYVTENRPVERTMMEQIVKTRPVKTCVEKKVQVDCCTGEELKDGDSAKTEAPAAAAEKKAADKPAA